MSEIIELIMRSNLQVMCPKCGEILEAKKANLFDIREKYPPKIFSLIKSIINEQKILLLKNTKKYKDMASRLKSAKNDFALIKEKIRSKPKRVKTITKHVNIGQIFESVLPASKHFKYDQKDCRAIFDPIDYISFNGLSKKNVSSITLIEIKSGEATLQRNQKNIRNQIENNCVKYMEY